MTNKIERLIDANFNRLKEALRLLEDIQRYIFDNKELSYAFKNIRHSLTPLFNYKRVLSRDIEGDVSKESIDLEMQREELIDVINANFFRAQESSRVLEEIFKLNEPKNSIIAKNIRYSLYSLHKKVLKDLIE